MRDLSWLEVELGRGGCNSFIPPSWFTRDVTFLGEYQNSRLIHLIRLRVPGSWDFVIAYRKDSYLSSAARNFIDITKSAFEVLLLMKHRGRPFRCSRR